jgi:type I restriction enzyme S subunit
LRQINQGAAQPNLNTDLIKIIDLPLCSLEEQNQIVQEIESRLSVCDKIEETIQNSLTKAEALRQSILKKAFEGKLLDAKELEAIKNHPEYESAEKLLQRIKLERAKK